MKLYQTESFPFHLIPAPLIAWYREKKRSLPWREDPTPYRVWVSEIMLQQTRVEAAKEYYLRFLEALPDVFALAECEEEKLLKLWEGLGYYSRVRNMQKAAKIVVERFGGKFPDEESILKSLPGIGEYTAGAILSIAFGKPVPAVDGNVFRVMSRLCENPTDISLPAYRGYLKDRLAEVYPTECGACSDFTQSLMELGALICKPLSPDCFRCPLRKICRAAEHGTQGSFPVLPEKKEKRAEKVFVFLIRTPKGIAVRKRETGVLKGMNEFPSCVVQGTEAPEEILNEWGMSAFTIERSKNYTHIFTHIRWEMTCFLVSAQETDFTVYPLEEIESTISIPTAFKQCMDILYLLA